MVKFAFIALWVGTWITFGIYAYKKIKRDDALLAMSFFRNHINLVGKAYQQAVADGAIEQQELCYNELTALVEQYNKNFEKYGGHYDIDRWIKKED